MRRFAALGLLVLCGCSTYSLEELKRAEPKGNAFQKELAREYMELSAAAERGYDWSTSWHYADKGLVTVYGNDVGPENIEDHHLPQDKVAELTQAREDLLSALRPEVVEAQPLLAARAYSQFDCWVIRQEQAWQEAPIAECREGFKDALAQLSAAPKMAAAAGETSSYIVFFEWNQAALSKAGLGIVKNVLKELEQETSYEIILNGHTDTTGLERYNLQLSKRRAEAVKAALVKGGANEAAIKIFAFGESDLRVPTADNVNEPGNRRVEIFIQ